MSFSWKKTPLKAIIPFYWSIGWKNHTHSHFLFSTSQFGLLVATSADARTLSSNNLYTSSSLTTFSVDVPNQLWSISFSKPCQNDNANCKLLHLLEWLMKWLSLATLTETVFNEWHFNCSFLTDWNNLYQIKNGLAKFLWKCIFEKKKSVKYCSL